MKHCCRRSFYITEHVLELAFAAGGVVCAGGGGGGGGGGVDFEPNSRAKKPGCGAGVSFFAESLVCSDDVGFARVFVAGARKLPRTPSTGLEPIV